MAWYELNMPWRRDRADANLPQDNNIQQPTKCNIQMLKHHRTMEQADEWGSMREQGPQMWSMLNINAGPTHIDKDVEGLKNTVTL